MMVCLPFAVSFSITIQSSTAQNPTDHSLSCTASVNDSGCLTSPLSCIYTFKDSTATTPHTKNFIIDMGNQSCYTFGSSTITASTGTDSSLTYTFKQNDQQLPAGYITFSSGETIISKLSDNLTIPINSTVITISNEDGSLSCAAIMFIGNNQNYLTSGNLSCTYTGATTKLTKKFIIDIGDVKSRCISFSSTPSNIITTTKNTDNNDLTFSFDYNVSDLLGPEGTFEGFITFSSGESTISVLDDGTTIPLYTVVKTNTIQSSDSTLSCIAFINDNSCLTSTLRCTYTFKDSTATTPHTKKFIIDMGDQNCYKFGSSIITAATTSNGLTYSFKQSNQTPPVGHVTFSSGENTISQLNDGTIVPMIPQ